MTDRGFTLLEALVSMLLIATIGMASFDWINSSLENMERIEAHHLRQQAIKNALIFMETVNPMEYPSGEIKMGHYTVQWNSSSTEPAKDGAGYPFGLSLYHIGLYDMHVKIDINDKEIAKFDVRRTGYRQEREFKIAF
jgi:general secretion pathway protein I